MKINGKSAAVADAGASDQTPPPLDGLDALLADLISATSPQAGEAEAEGRAATHPSAEPAQPARSLEEIFADAAALLADETASLDDPRWQPLLAEAAQRRYVPSGRKPDPGASPVVRIFAAHRAKFEEFLAENWLVGSKKC